MFLQIGPAFLDIEEGILFPASPVGSHSAETLPPGKPRLSPEPPAETEASQPELFTGSETPDPEIRKGVLVLTEKAMVDTLLLRDTAGGAASGLTAKAEQIYKAWQTGTVRRLLGVEMGVYQASLGDAGFESYAAVWASDSDLGKFYYLVDPADHEPVTLGKFIPHKISDKEKRKLELETEWEKKQGRYVEFAFEDLGNLDTFRMYGVDIPGILSNPFNINTILLVAHKSFTA
jgi:hypothetical protein